MPDAAKPQAALGEAIRRMRRREGLTQEELAFRAGVHPTWISRLESGRSDPRWSSVRSVARGLGTSLIELTAMAERIKLD
jgi:transcriptional regulator with XRE-family HTH domain